MAEFELKLSRVLKDMFTKADTDNDGELSKREFEDMILDCGYRMPAQDVKELFDSMDKNKNGSISFPEFKKAMEKAVSLNEHKRAKLRKEFQKRDRQRSGSISITDLAEVCTEFGNCPGPAKLVEIAWQCDKERSGLIDFEEYIKQYCSDDR